MFKFLSFPLLFLCLLGLWPMKAFAQTKENKIVELPEDFKASPSPVESIFLNFNNVNKIPFYYNKKGIDLIEKLNRERNWKKLYPVLEAYVKNFGIENFWKDTYWLWRYAKITESMGDLQKAKALYKLVLKHNRSDINIQKVELHYDSLIANEKDHYVELDYYYELVDFRSQIDTLKPPRGVLLNMGPMVNSSFSDYGPILHFDNKILIFTSKRNERREGVNVYQNEDLFFSTRENDEWQPAHEMKGLNSIYNEGSACISRDGKVIYFSRCDAPDSYGNCDLFEGSLLPDGSWGKVKNLGAEVNSKSWDSHPSLSHSEDTLYFSSDMLGGFGMADIWFTYKDQFGKWTKAQNMGPTINTRLSEVSPYFHPKYNILYFSSNGQLLNFGEFDIFKSYRLKHGWAEPQNVGPLVNGPGSEFYFTIDSESKELFYGKSTDSNLQNMDLYSFPLPMEAQPNSIVKFKGSLVDSASGKPLAGIVSIIDMDQGIEVAPKYIRPDGTFEFDLINKNNYLLIIQGDAFFRIEEMFYLDGDTEFHRRATPIKSKLKFESLEFANGKADILPSMYSDLDKMVNFLIDNPDFKLKISGHTDSDGSEDSNHQLSQKRAEAIQDYLIHYGIISPDRIQAKGYGSSRPLVDEVTEADKKINRRVEFEMYKDLEEAVN